MDTELSLKRLQNQHDKIDEPEKKKPRIESDGVDFGAYRGCGTQEGVAVGALITPAKLMQKCKFVLDQKGWVKKTGYPTNIVKMPQNADTDPVSLALPISPDGCVALNHFISNHYPQESEIPEPLQQLLKEGAIKFASGMRLGPHPHEIQARAKFPPTHIPRQNPKFKFIELFAGIGGFRVACARLGGECVFASEINRKACETYFLNFGHYPDGDITEIETNAIPKHELLTAGFPCQSFSVMGSQEGLGDERGNLFWEIIRVIRKHQPRSILLENVPGLKLNQDGKTFDLIMAELKSAGYHVKEAIINANGWVPQERLRLYFVGFLSKDEYDRFSFPEAPPVSRCVRDILESDIPNMEAYALTDFQWEKIRKSNYYNKKPTGRVLDLSGTSRTLRSKYRRGYQMCSQFVPQEGKNPRFFTPREAARLQGFPEDYKIPQTEGTFYKQIGNSVCPLVIQEILTKILGAWGSFT